ncbi:MAG: GntR family transcriptional regulator, partial [Clostridium sp.]|nr:GntR family transcriptional regulator [Clostridium sp.]
MLTYELKKSPGVPLYEALYRCIRQDILSGKLSPGEKLPSKRALAQNLEVSKITV